MTTTFLVGFLTGFAIGSVCFWLGFIAGRLW